jgi:hypothetical protein
MQKMQKFKTLLTVIGAVTVLVLAGNTVAMAATGGKFILGHTNKANAVSTLKRTTSGAPLKLTTNSSSNAPLSTNGKGKVTNLNADKLDGYDSSSLKTKTYVFTKHLTTPATSLTMTAAVPAGTYLVSYSAFFNSSPSTALGSVDCFIHTNSGGITTTGYFAESYFTTTGIDAAATGSGVAVMPSAPGSYLRLECSADVPFVEWGSTEPYQLTLTKIDSAPTSALRVGGNARVAK